MEILEEAGISPYKMTTPALSPTTIPNLLSGEVGYTHTAGFQVAISKQIAPDRPTGRAAFTLTARYVDANGTTLSGTRPIQMSSGHDTRSPHALYIANSHLGAYVLAALTQQLGTAQAQTVWQNILTMAQKDQTPSAQAIIQEHLDIFAEHLGSEFTALQLCKAIEAI